MDFNNYEYIVDQRGVGKWRVMRLLMLLGYVLYCAAYFLAIYISRIIPLGALIPVTLWILVYFTWRYTKPSYKYAIESGTLTYTVLYGTKTKRVKFSTKIHDAKMIAPIDDVTASLSEAKIEKIYDGAPSNDNRDIYGMLFEEGGKSYLLRFKATRDGLRALRYYNSATVISETAL